MFHLKFSSIQGLALLGWSIFSHYAIGLCFISSTLGVALLGTVHLMTTINFTYCQEKAWYFVLKKNCPSAFLYAIIKIITLKIITFTLYVLKKSRRSSDSLAYKDAAPPRTSMKMSSKFPHILQKTQFLLYLSWPFSAGIYLTQVDNCDRTITVISTSIEYSCFRPTTMRSNVNSTFNHLLFLLKPRF